MNGRATTISPIRPISGGAFSKPGRGAKDEYLQFIETRSLKWYRSSSTAQRGFCSECRSTLFWKGDGRDYTAIAASAIDGPTGLKLAGHIFCDDAGDYYEISGELIMPRGASNRTLDKLAGHGVRWTVLPYDKMQLNGGGIHCSTTALIHDAA